MRDDDVLFEIRRIGSYAKVAAIDPETNTEVSTVGPASTDDRTLRMAALRKLKYVLAKRSG
ncbi:MAG: hypothetical protein HQL41_02670 [Alphaproteobacteria bacterium]|nr:hypothetical protein [Alphaproteobacteria bacterium]